MKQRLLDLEEATLKHVNNVNSVVETEFARQEKVIGAVEKHQLGGIDDLRREYLEFKNDSSKWRVDFEDINSKKLQEIHEAIKLVNNMVGKGSIDMQDKSEIIKAESKLLENTL